MIRTSCFHHQEDQLYMQCCTVCFQEIPPPQKKMEQITTHRTNQKLSISTYSKIKLPNYSTNTKNYDRNNNIDKDKKIWITFAYYSPLACKITNLFKHTNVGTSFKSINTVHHFTNPETTNNIEEHKMCWIYKVTCGTRNTSDRQIATSNRDYKNISDT